MGNKEAVKRKTSAKSTASASAHSLNTSILRSAFVPSTYDLTLFASVIQGFDFHQLRIHDFTDGRLLSSHRLAAGVRVNSLDWGRLSSNDSSLTNHIPQKRRKGLHDAPKHTGSHIVVALGTSASDIQIFSVTENRIVATLTGVHTREVLDFKFVQDDCRWGWSAGADERIVQWNLKAQQSSRTITLADSSIALLATLPLRPLDIFCASVTPYQVQFDPSQPETADPTLHAFDSLRNQIQTMCFSGQKGSDTSEFFLAGDGDRYINIYDVHERKLARTLICRTGLQKVSLMRESKDQTLSLEDQQLAVVSSNGFVEFFSGPFAPRNESKANISIKSKRKGLTSKAEAALKFVLPDSTNPVPIVDLSMQQEDLIVAWVSGGIDLSFEKIRWREDETLGLRFSGTTEIIATKKNSTFTSREDEEVQVHGRTHVDESQAVVINDGVVELKKSRPGTSKANQTIDSASNEDSSSEDADSEEGNDEVRPLATEKMANGVGRQQSDSSDVEMIKMIEAAPARSESEVSDAGEKSFGALMAENTEQPVIVVDMTSGAGPVVPVDHPSGALTSGITLSTVLSQALRTNDNSLLESCLHNTDAQVIQKTIRRMETSLAGPLIMKLAERLSSRPGRYGSLIMWVQWICIAHGGAIGGQPEIIETVKLLYKVLDERSKSLTPLLLLKGKLDMLDAQMELRNEFQAIRETRSLKQGHAIYIEGQEQDSSDEDAMLGIEAGPSSSRPKRTLDDVTSGVGDESEDDDDMPMTNGAIIADSHEHGSDEEEEEEEAYEIERDGLLDEEAMESGQDNLGDDSEGSDDVSEARDDSEEEDSEMDDFIDDGPIEVASESDFSIDKETPEKPPSKKVRRY